jgi:hypothetical protein
LLLLLTFLAAGLVRAEAAGAREVLSWEDLMPPGKEAPLPLFGHPGTYFDLDEVAQPGTFEVNDTILGQEVELSGFAVPLELVGGRVSRFLLVPYFGACIHLPPPPPNQIVDVTLAEPVRLRSLDEPVTARGFLRSDKVETDLAGAAYVIRGGTAERAKRERRR